MSSCSRCSAPRPNDRARFTAARAARALRAHGARGRRLQSAILARAAGGVALPPQPPLVAAAVLDHRDRGRRGDGGGHRAGAGARGDERAAVGPAGEDPHREPAPAGAHLRGGAAAGSRFNPSLGAFIPRYHRFEVTGLFDTGMYEYDNSYVAMDRRVAQRFADLDKAVTGLEVRLADPWQARAFGLRLETELGYPYRALDWQSQNASLFSALKLEKLAMAVVVFLIGVVAAFNVVGTLTMLVRDKTREIGILLAMGLRRTSIRRIFLAQGILIGLTGTGLGVLLGLVLGGMVNQGQWIHIDPSIYFIDHLPVRTQLVDVFAVIAASLAVATFAPLYPSVQAARLEPVAAIRYE